MTEHERRNRDQDILKTLLFDREMSTRDIARYVYADKIAVYGFDENHPNEIRRAIKKRLLPKGLIEYKKKENVKGQLIHYYSLSFKGSIIALKYCIERIASKEVINKLKDGTITDKFKEGIREHFHVILKNPSIDKDKNVITINENSIRIVIDKKIGILMNGSIVSLLVIRKDGMYAYSTPSKELANLNELKNGSISENLRRYLLKRYGVSLKNTNIKSEGDRIVIYRKYKNEDKELATMYIKDNHILLNIEDKRLNYTKSSTLIIVNDNVYHGSDIFNYIYKNPFFNIYAELLNEYKNPFMMPFLKYLFIDGIIYGLEKGIINENMNDALIILSTILSINENIRLLLKYDREYASLFLFLITDILTDMIIKRQKDKKMPLFYYPSSKDSIDMKEYILNTLFDNVASIIIEKHKDIDIIYNIVMNGVKDQLKNIILLAHPTLVKIVILLLIFLEITDKDSREYKVFNAAWNNVYNKLMYNYNNI